MRFWAGKAANRVYMAAFFVRFWAGNAAFWGDGARFFVRYWAGKAAFLGSLSGFFSVIPGRKRGVLRRYRGGAIWAGKAAIDW